MTSLVVGRLRLGVERAHPHLLGLVQERVVDAEDLELAEDANAGQAAEVVRMQRLLADL
ncbi:hypothetical protein [Nocardioides ginkgobilobae]